MKNNLPRTLLIILIVVLAIMIPRLRLAYREHQMEQMLMEHGVMSSDGELLSPYSGGR